MKWIKYTILILAPAVLTLLDTAFFSNLTIKDASIISVFQFLILFSLIADAGNCLVFAAFSVFFFSIFSSLPLWLIFLLFFILPSMIMYLRRSHLPLPSVPASAIFFVLSNAIFEMILLLYSKQWSSAGFSVLYYFVLINSIIGVVIYYVAHLIIGLSTRGKINGA